MIEVEERKKTYSIVRDLQRLNVASCAMAACKAWLKGRKVTGAVLAKLSFPDTHVVIVLCGEDDDRIIVPADEDGRITQWKWAVQPTRD